MSRIQPLKEFAAHVDEIFAGHSRPVMKWARKMAYGMLVSRTCSITQIAAALEEKAKNKGAHSTPGKPRRPIHTIKGLDRTLVGDRVLDEQLESRIAQKSGEIIAQHGGRWVVAVDTTDLGHPHSQPWRSGGMELTYMVRDGSRAKRPKKPPNDPTEKWSVDTPKHRGYQVLMIQAAELGGCRNLPVCYHLFSQAEERLQDRTWLALAADRIEKVLPHLPPDAIWVFDRGFDGRPFRGRL